MIVSPIEFQTESISLKSSYLVLIKCEVEFVSVVGPRGKCEVAYVLVKWKVSVSHITGALIDGLGDPEHLPSVENVNGMLIWPLFVYAEKYVCFYNNSAALLQLYINMTI